MVKYLSTGSIDTDVYIFWSRPQGWASHFTRRSIWGSSLLVRPFCSFLCIDVLCLTTLIHFDCICRRSSTLEILRRNGSASTMEVNDIIDRWQVLVDAWSLIMSIVMLILGFILPQIRIMRPCERGSQCTIHRNDGWRQASLMKLTILRTKRCYKHFLPECWFSQLVGGFSSVFSDFHQRSGNISCVSNFGGSHVSLPYE